MLSLGNATSNKGPRTFKSDFLTSFADWQTEIYNYDLPKSQVQNIFKRSVVDAICGKIVFVHHIMEDLDECDELVTICCNQFVDKLRDPTLEPKSPATQLFSAIRQNVSNLKIPTYFKTK